MKRVSEPERRRYVATFFTRLVSDSEFSERHWAFGPYSSILTITEVFTDWEPSIPDLYLDLLMFPGKAYFYRAELVHRMYHTLMLNEVNRRIRLIGWILFVAVRVGCKVSGRCA